MPNQILKVSQVCQPCLLYTSSMLKKTTESKLLAGYIYGDNVTKEYVYLPGSEVDTEEPMLLSLIHIYESQDGRREIIDLDIQHQRKAIVNEHDLQHQGRASHDVDVHSGQTAEKPHLRDADHGEKYTDWQ